MDTFNWVYSIPLIAIIGGITVAMYAIYLKNRHGGEEDAAGQDSIALNRQVLQRLDSIDARLAAVEKSLREHA